MELRTLEKYIMQKYLDTKSICLDTLFTYQYPNIWTVVWKIIGIKPQSQNKAYQWEQEEEQTNKDRQYTTIFAKIPRKYHTFVAQPSRGTKGSRDEEHILTSQTPHMKSQTHKQRRTAIEKPNGQ